LSSPEEGSTALSDKLDIITVRERTEPDLAFYSMASTTHDERPTDRAGTLNLVYAV